MNPAPRSARPTARFRRVLLGVAVCASALPLAAVPAHAAAAGAPAGPVTSAAVASAAGSPGSSGLPGPAGSASAPGPTDPGARQRAYEAAAAEFGVPLPVLLAVSYLGSRWDAHGGRPSVTGGYGPMHLTDVAAAAGGAGPPAGVASEPGLRTAEQAAALAGVPRQQVRSDPAENIRAGAALLAHYQRSLGAPLTGDVGKWYGAVARYSEATELGAARRFADEVYEVIRTGESRTTDDGQRVRLRAVPDVTPDTGAVEKGGALFARLSGGSGEPAPECPRSLACEWIPAPYQQLSDDPRDYGNHDKADRPRSQKITHIVVHDTETSYANTLRLVQDPTYVSWQYTIRSADGHVAQHVRHRDVAWQAGNWYINAKSIGIEHEGFLAQGSWYTEAMYRSSAELVRYLTEKYDIPRNRAHILGHDSVPGTVPETVQGMHEDPGPYWDWAHYFELLGAPLRGNGRPDSEMVVIRPDYATNKVPYTGCDSADPAKPCPEHGGASVMLRTEPRHDAPLVKDIGKHPPDGEATMSVYDHSARASTGAQYAVADRRGDWTAIWYLGQKAWFHNPASAPTAVPVRGWVATPKPGRASVPVYGRAYPEPEAYPPGVPVQEVVPLQYTFPAGQRYAVGLTAPSEYYFAQTYDPANHRVVRGRNRYYQLQFGHRVMYVNEADVDLIRVR